MRSLIQIFFLGIIVLFIASVLSVFDRTTENIVQNSKTLPVIEGEKKEEVFKEDLQEDQVAVIEDETTTSEEREIIIVVDEEVEMIVDIPEEVIIEQFKKEGEDVSQNQVDLEPKESRQISFSKINDITRKALVNVFCTTKSGGSFRPITGSGVAIDSRGVILTNAHVAQYFLIKDYLVEDFVDCVIRVDSPAKHMYKAKLIFISPSWIKNNTDNIIQSSPKGTGEDDYALLLITERTDSSKTLPDSFSFLEPLYNSASIDIGDDVLLAAYPAGFLSGISISRDLYISSAVTKIMEVFTFKDGTLDLFSIGGSVVAQQGSSGGAVVDTDNKLLGIIVTSSTADTTSERDLRAITIAHINRSFVKDTGFDLQTLFGGNMEAEVNAFNENIAPVLKQLLVDELKR